MIFKRLGWHYRRYRRQRKKIRWASFLIVLLTGLLIWRSFLFVIPAREPGYLEQEEDAVAVMGGEEDVGEITGAPGGHSTPGFLGVLKYMLALNIPGFEGSSTVMVNLDGREFFNRALHSLLGVDINDPRTLLGVQLAAFSLVPLPVVQPPPTREDEGDIDSGPDDEFAEEEEKIVEEEKEEEIEEEKLYFDAAHEDPVILIYHSHTTESFIPTSGEAFTENLEQTVAYLGEHLAAQLQEEYGLPVLHNKKIHDLPRRYAYQEARPTVKEILEEYPSIEILIDLHRDGISRESTTATINGEEKGKFLIVIGSKHDRWQENMRLAVRLQKHFEEVEPDLSRGIRRQNFVYNQDLHPGSLLVEIGGHKNSLEEALLSVPYLARALAQTYDSYFEEDDS